MAFFLHHYERPARKHYRWWHNWAVRCRLKPDRKSPHDPTPLRQHYYLSAAPHRAVNEQETVDRFAALAKPCLTSLRHNGQ